LIVSVTCLHKRHSLDLHSVLSGFSPSDSAADLQISP